MTTTEMHEIGFENSLGPVLPAHLFKSWETWWIYEFMKNDTWELSQFVLMLLTVCFLNLCSDVHFIILFLFVLYTIFFYFTTMKNYPKPFPNNKLLYGVILDINPGVDARKWDIATFKVNKVLYDQGYRKTPYYFFKRSNCFSAFRKYLLSFDSKASEQYKLAVNNHFNDLLQEKHINFDFSLGKELDVKLISGKGFTEHVLFAIVFTFLAITTTRNDKNRKVLWYLVMPCRVGLFVLFFACLITTYKNRHAVKYGALGILERIKFLVTIMQVAPGNHMGKWDQIARHMNYYLHEKGVWKRPEENFFDGKECSDFYRSRFEPLASGSKELSYIEFRDIVNLTNKVCGSSTVELA